MSRRGIPSGNSKLLELGAIKWPKLKEAEHIKQRLREQVKKRKSKRKAEQLDVTKVQLNNWLKIAVEDKAITKPSRPIRYALTKEDNS